MEQEHLSVDSDALLIELRNLRTKLISVRRAIKVWNKQLRELSTIAVELARTLETKDFIVRATDHKLKVLSDVTEMLHKVDMKIRLLKETKEQYIKLQKLKARSGSVSLFGKIIRLTSKERASQSFLAKHQALRNVISANLEDINTWRQQADVLGFSVSQSKIFLGFQTLIAGPLDERVERSYRIMERRLNNFQMDLGYKQKSIRSRKSRRKLKKQRSSKASGIPTRGKVDKVKRKKKETQKKSKHAKRIPEAAGLVPFVEGPKEVELDNLAPDEDDSSDSDTSEYASSETNFAEREYYLSDVDQIDDWNL